MSTTTELFRKALDNQRIETTLDTDANAFEDVLRSGRSVRMYNDVCMVISAGKRAKPGIYGPRIRFDTSICVFAV